MRLVVRGNVDQRRSGITGFDQRPQPRRLGDGHAALAGVMPNARSRSAAAR
jgi:hypothetical protein